MWRGEAVITANPARLVLIKVGWLVGWSWSFLLQTNRRAALVATALVSLMSALMQGAAYLIGGIIIMIAFKKIYFSRLFWSTLRVPMEVSHGFRLTDKRQQQDRWIFYLSL